jgi:hypothetical protein
MPRNQKRQLQRLLLIKPGIAVRRVVVAQVLIIQALATPRALRDRVARELQVHAAQEGAVLLMDFECRRQLRKDTVERAGLDACWGTASIAAGGLADAQCMTAKHNLPVHRVALPNDNMSTALYSFNMRTQHRFNLICTIAGNQSDLPNLFVGVDNVKQLH